MDFYRKRADILLSKNISNDIESERESFSKVDKELISGDVVRDIDINNITELPDGRIRIVVDDVRFECLFKKGKNDKLWVFPSAARFRGDGLAPLPLLQRWSYYNILEDSVLCVSDPMYYKYPKLGCAWFWGDDEKNYRDYLAYIVRKIVNYLRIRDENVVFMGSSSGGTVSVHTAAIFGAGTAISINGQLNFEKEKYTSRLWHFKNQTGIDITQKDIYKRNELYSVVKETPNVKYIFITNASSEGDIEDHLMYFSEKVGYVPRYGLSAKDNMIFWIYDAKSANPHTAFEDRNILWAIEYLTKVNPKEVDDYDGLYRVFGNIWFSNYKKIEEKNNKNYELLPSVFDLLNASLDNNLKNVHIESSDNKYNRFVYKDFKKQRIYTIKFNAKVSGKNGMITAGLYDGKNFVFKHCYDSDKDNTICFCCNNDSKLEFCIFSGLHGEANNKDLTVNYFDVYSSEVVDDSVLNFFKDASRDLEARIDLKLISEKAGNIYLEKQHDFRYDVSSPKWINNSKTKGYVIQSKEGYLKIKTIVDSAGELVINFKGIDWKYSNKRIPIWVDYTCIRVNEEEIIHSPVSCWHDKVLRYDRKVNSGDEIILEVCWTKHN